MRVTFEQKASAAPIPSPENHQLELDWAGVECCSEEFDGNIMVSRTLCKLMSSVLLGILSGRHMRHEETVWKYIKFVL